MSVEPTEFRPRPDEEAVHHPQLRRLVEAARAQPMPRVRVDEEAVLAGWQEHRARRRRAVGMGLAAAAVVVLALTVVLPARHVADADAQASASASPMTEARSPSEVATEGTPDGMSKRGPPPATDAATGAAAEPLRLAEGIEVTPWSEDAAPPEASPQLLGPDRLRLPPGRWSVETEAGRRAEVVLPDRTLELHGAHIHVEVAGDVARVEVLRGEVTEHHAADPARLEAPAEPAESRRAPLDADALAREAEVHLAAGRRGEAIKSLRRLVTRFPRSAAAQAGLIDLGRLLEREGQADRARCAYALFLERWPSHSLRGDVASAQRALGPGPACDGLRPER